MRVSVPTLDEIRAARTQLGDRVKTTPTTFWSSHVKNELLGDQTEVYLKLELLQYAGSFKPRGALLVMDSLDKVALAQGVTAVSAGNHAIAVGYAAKACGTTAKVVMPKTANPYRVEACRRQGTEVVLVDDVAKAFDEVERIRSEEGRFFVHPFEGPLTALGTATVGLEMCEQAPDLDVVIVPIGGGGLAAGIGSAVKQMLPNAKVIGVEPEGANSMSLSLKKGGPESIEAVNTIADSLGAPFALPYSFGLVQQTLDKVVTVTDNQMAQAMCLSFEELKLAVEPAAAAALAALLGPLHDECKGKRVGLVACGSNIDLATWLSYTTSTTTA
ncbi:pyridoxal-phosphate dependent enzyme [Pontibacter sp. G13]|uniref:threonine ammonia-lyase n=1 Tax=Pontibacter sp. G13 TaxID=3074898 RepID=UPI002889E7AD|nr:pyridoxal-phosphate dependent enzyme [Pontibacter sp. G13]WNJ20186.1 pyridoxal-phosphate dependent enzyme [Pontibacter sp. G13]